MGKMYDLYREGLTLETDRAKEFLDLISNLLSTEEVQTLANFEQHMDINRLDHVKCVAFMSYILCKEKGLDYEAAARAGILHDLFYYDWRNKDDGSHRLHGFRHGGFAAENAKKITSLSKREENIIRRHMWPLTPTPPKYREAYVVTMCDKYSASAELLSGCHSVSKKFINKIKSK